MDLFVAQLPSRVNEAILESLFAKFGKVDSAKVVYDRVTGESKKYGFVSMPDDIQAQAAIDALNDFEIDGKKIVVKKADPPKKSFKIRM
jgi:RNA recognition motif-containing protein